jgi:hypothetical protein
MANGRRMRGANRNLAQRPPSTSSWLSIGKTGPVLGSAKTGPSGFPGSGQYLCSREFIQQAIQDTITVEFRRLGSSSKGVSINALLPRATNAWAVGAYADDVSALFTIGRVVWTLGSIVNALSLGMVRTS